jgi:hypothetical protein
VAPVVTTSSTIQIWVGIRPRALNAPRRLRRRSRRSRPVWLGVSRTRRKATGSSGRRSSRASARASSAAGLKPRARRRRGWSGTGTISSGAGPGARAAASRTRPRASARGAGSMPAIPALGYLKRSGSADSDGKTGG